MPIEPPVPPYRLTSPELPNTLHLTEKVTVTPNLDNPKQWTVSWQKVSGAVRYYVYAAPTPVLANASKFEETLPSQSSVVFELPILLPENFLFYFWVAYVAPNGQVIPLQTEPAYVSNDTAFSSNNPLSFGTQRDITKFGDINMPNNDMRGIRYYVQEIRRRHMAIVENDGEDFYLYIRRNVGQPCVCTQKAAGGLVRRTTPQSIHKLGDLGRPIDPAQPTTFETVEAKDPEYQGSYRCTDCFGTGIAGGYYPKIRLRIRYGNLPRRIIHMKEGGMDIEHDFNSHTIWHPRPTERDFLIRLRTGERFFIKKPGGSELRGMVLHQEFDAVAADRTDMIFKVNDEKIQQALENEGAWDIGKFNWGVWA